MKMDSNPTPSSYAMSPSSVAQTYRPVNSKRLHEAVVQQVVQQVVRGVIAPRSVLPSEPELAQQFGVSRTVIREAVRILVSKGLVAVKHGSGVRVQPPDAWDNLDPLILFERVQLGGDNSLLDELLEVRRLLEVEVATLAALRRMPDELEQLRAAVRSMRTVLHDPDAYTHLDIGFHNTILVAARNRLLHQVLLPVGRVLNAGRFISIRQPSAVEQSMRGHEEILFAIEHEDAESAQAAMHRHILQFEADIRAALQTRFGSRSMEETGESTPTSYWTS